MGRPSTMRVSLAAALATLLVAGCGGGGGPAPEAAVAEAATKTTEAGSGRIAITAETEVPDRGTLTFDGEGVFDYENRRGHMTLDLSSLVGGGDPSTGHADFVFDELVMYMRFPALTRALGTRKPWIKVDLEAAARQEGMDVTQFTQFNQDPTQSIQYLRAASTEIDEVGKERVRGVETTHYRGTVDVDDLVEVARPRDRAQLESYARRLRTAGLDRFPLDVWIDEDGLIRRLRVEYENLSTGAAAISLSTTVEFYDFGVDATIEAPPRNQVTPFGDLIGRGAEETKHSEE